MKFLLSILLILTIGYTTVAQNRNFSVVFNHVALSVSDLEQSAEFYSTVLNLQEITNRTEKAGIRWFSLGEDKELHLISSLEGEIQLNKAVHFALSVSDFDQFVDFLKERSIQYSDWPGNINKVFVRADGVKQVYVQDPDGYWIEVNSAQ